MKTGVKNMTEGNPLSLLLSFSLPLMLSNMCQQLYLIVDTAVVGKVLGIRALAALGAVDWIYWMMVSTIQGYTQGFGIKMANRFGAGDTKGLQNTVSASMKLSIYGALLLLSAGQLLVRPMLNLLDTPGEIMEIAVEYLKVMFAGIPIIMLYNYMSVILRSLGDGKSPMIAIILSTCMNVVLTILLVSVLGWEIAGAGLASVTSQAVSGIYCTIQVLKIRDVKSGIRFRQTEAGQAKELLGLGTPLAIQNIIVAVGGIFVQYVVNGYSVIFISGFAAGTKLIGLMEMAALSYGSAMVTYVGQNLGARKIDRIRNGIKNASWLALATSVVIGSLMLIFGKSLLLLFISGTDQEVKESLEIGYAFLSTMAVCLPMLYILHVYRSSLQGLGNAILPMVSGVLESVTRISVGLILPAIIGYKALFLPEVCAWLGSIFVLVPGFFIFFKKSIAPTHGRS